MKHLSLPELLMPFPHMQRVSVYRKIKSMPHVTGVLFCETLAIGERHSQSALLFGPSCTFETWQAAENKPIQGSDTALTNPLYAQAYAMVPNLFREQPQFLDDLIRAEERAAEEELPRLWVGRRKGNGIRMHDLILREDKERTLKVLTWSDTRGDRFLVCPLEEYSDERDTDETSIDFGYSKNHHKWEWKTLADLFDVGYRTLADKTGEIYCTLVRNKKEERGIE